MKRFIFLILLLPNFISPFPKKIEGWAWVGFNYDLYVPLNIVGTVQFKGVLNSDLISKALRIMQERHPTLACRAFYNVNAREWILEKSDQEIPLHIVKRTSDEHWQSIMSDELDNKLPAEEGPLVRMIYCKGNDRGELIVTLHHSISDGIGQTYFMFEFFKLMDDLKYNRQIDTITDHFLELDYRDLYEDINKIAVVQQSKNAHPKDVSNYKVFFIPFCFSKEETEIIQKKYRSCGSSLQTFLSAAVVKAVERHRFKRDSQTPFKIFCHHPINIRSSFKNAKLTGYDFGDWVGDINTEHTIDSTVDIIQLSKEIKEQLYQGIQEKKHLQFLQYMDRFVATTDFSQEEIFHIAQVDHPTATVSQLGTLDFPCSYGDITVERLHGLFNWRGYFVHEDTFIMTGSIFQNQLMGMFACIEPVVSRDDAQEMSTHIKKLLVN